MHFLYKQLRTDGLNFLNVIFFSSDLTKCIVEILGNVDEDKHEDFLERILDDLGKRNRELFNKKKEIVD